MNATDAQLELHARLIDEGHKLFGWDPRDVVDYAEATGSITPDEARSLRAEEATS